MKIPAASQTREDVKAELVKLVPRLRRFAYAICGNREEGDDLVQSACVKALNSLDSFRPGTRLDSWMFRIVQTTHIDAVRQKARRGRYAGGEIDTELPDPREGVEQADNRLLLGRVRAAMETLPEDQRLVIALVAIDGHSYKEAAEILDVPVGTIMSRLARGRARLMAAMGEDEP